MKITIAYIPDEEEAVTTSVAALRRIFPDIRTRKSDRHPPFKLASRARLRWQAR